MVIRLNEQEIEHILTEHVRTALDYPNADCVEVGYDQNTESVYFRFEVTFLLDEAEEEGA